MKNLRDIIPKNLIYLRKQHKFTQIDLAKKINYSDKAVSRWEKGEVLPDVEVLQKVCEVYDIPIANNKATADYLITSPLFNSAYTAESPAFAAPNTGSTDVGR